MVLLICGKSGAGKDTLVKKLIDHNFIKLISTTTRPKRDGEVDGVDYFFISKEQFLRDIEEENLVNFRSYGTEFNNYKETWYYGTPKYVLNKNKNYVFIADIDGIEKMSEYLKDKMDYRTIYIDVDDDIRKMRAKKRGSFCETEWNRRLEDDNNRFYNVKTDLKFSNNKMGDLDIAIYEILKLIDKTNFKMSRTNEPSNLILYIKKRLSLVFDSLKLILQGIIKNIFNYYVSNKTSIDSFFFIFMVSFIILLMKLND